MLQSTPMPNIGPMELLLLGVVAVLLFGPAKMPEMARSIGKATREFKDSVTGTGIGEALEGVNDVRSAMTPSNLAKAAMPAPVKEMAAGVTEMKETFTDPLGDEEEGAGRGRGCGRAPPAEAEPLPAARELPSRPRPRRAAAPRGAAAPRLRRFLSPAYVRLLLLRASANPRPRGTTKGKR